MQHNQQMMQGTMPAGESGERSMGMAPRDETWYTGGGPVQTPPRDDWSDSQPPQSGGMWTDPGRGGMSPQHAQSQRMKNPVGMAETHAPADNAQAYQASLRSLLSRNIGYYIICTFLVGNQQHVSWQGILHTVGSDYLVLYQPDFERYISCDLYSLKFVQFHDSRTAPHCSDFQSMQGQTVW